MDRAGEFCPATPHPVCLRATPGPSELSAWAGLVPAADIGADTPTLVHFGLAGPGARVAMNRTNFEIESDLGVILSCINTELEN